MRLPTLENYHFIISLLIRITILFAMAGAIVNARWTVLFICIMTLVLTFIPAIIEKNYKISLPVELEIVIVLFIYGALFLGEIHDYYTLFWWWDVVLHTGSGIALGFIGFVILYVMYKENKITAKPITIAFFSFAFAVAIGTLWEIFEFSMDQLFGMNMQKNGLRDTMWDLIVDSLGALLTSILGFFYIKGARTPIFDRVFSKFLIENPGWQLSGMKKRKKDE